MVKIYEAFSVPGWLARKTCWKEADGSGFGPRRRLTAAASAPESPVYRQSINILSLSTSTSISTSFAASSHIHINFRCCIFSFAIPFFALFGLHISCSSEVSPFCSNAVQVAGGFGGGLMRPRESSAHPEETRSQNTSKKKIHPHPCWILRVSTPCSVLWTRLTVTSTSSRGVAAAVRREPL